MQRILSTNVTRLIVEIRSSYVNTREGHYNCDGPRIYATAPLPYIILDGYGVHTAPVKVVQQKFRRLWCRNCAGYVFDRIGSKFDLDFSVRIFERLSVQMFVC